MASTVTFLDLTNRVLKAFNEVNLTSSNFSTADGFYQEAKDAVNQAIFDIYTEQDVQWPFAWNETTFNTVAGTQEYSKASDALAIDWESFRILSDPSNDIIADHIPSIEYNVYRREYWQGDQETTADERTQPSLVVRKPDNNFILTPVPDQVYTIEYEYYTMPSALSAYDDTTSIPDEFVQMIVDKALHYAYMFRDNVEQAALAQKRYESNVNKVRRILIPQFQNVVMMG